MKLPLLSSGSLGERGVLVFAMLCLLVASSFAYAADASTSATPVSALDAAAVLGPMGINPAATLAVLGFAAAIGIYQLPAGIELFSNPFVIIVLALFGFFLHVGRSSKLTKPFAEAAGLAESAFALVAVVALAAPLFGDTGVPGPVQAGLGEGFLFVVSATSAVAALVILRTALDIMIWLSPFPFVDGLFQAVKLGATLLLIGAVILSPPVALVLNFLILIATFFLVRWAVRTARFGLTVAYDLTFGRSAARALDLPRDEIVDGDLGPFRCFALRTPGLPRRARAQLELRAGRWFLVGAGPGGPNGSPDTPLGDGERTVIVPTWAGLELRVGDVSVLLPPRYKQFEETIRLESRAQVGGQSQWVPPIRGRRQARPSTL